MESCAILLLIFEFNSLKRGVLEGVGRALVSAAGIMADYYFVTSINVNLILQIKWSMKNGKLIIIVLVIRYNFGIQVDVP